MDRSTVALVRCEGYDSETVYDALKRGVELLGGLGRFVRPGERILLKPNILAGDSPEKAVTTHPAVLTGCVRLFRAGGAAVSFGDSPGLENAVHAARGAGLEDAGLRCGAALGDFSTGGPLDNPAGRRVGARHLLPAIRHSDQDIQHQSGNQACLTVANALSLPVARAVHECDGIVNLPKLKTHQLTRITGAGKNLFGCIPGKRKALYHVQFQDIMDFCGLLAEINLRLRPRLHVLDAVVAMEGNGPRSGDPRPLNVLVLSTDPVAVDATACRLVDLDPAFVPTSVVGHQAGRGQYQDEGIEYVGDTLADLRRPDFKLIRKPAYGNASYTFYSSIKRLVVPRPVLSAARCIQCGLCVAACPVPDKALQFANGRTRPPRYDYDRCIRCYCCQEMCPQRAIRRKTPLLGRVLRLASWRRFGNEPPRTPRT